MCLCETDMADGLFGLLDDLIYLQPTSFIFVFFEEIPDQNGHYDFMFKILFIIIYLKSLKVDQSLKLDTKKRNDIR